MCALSHGALLRRCAALRRDHFAVDDRRVAADGRLIERLGHLELDQLVAHGSSLMALPAPTAIEPARCDHPSLQIEAATSAA